MAEDFIFVMQIPLYFAFLSSLNSWDHVCTVSVCLSVGERVFISVTHTHTHTWAKENPEVLMSPKGIKSTIKHFPVMPMASAVYLCTQVISRAAALWRDPNNQIHAHASVGVSCQGVWRVADESRGKPNEEWTRSLPFRSALWLHKRQMLTLPLDCSPQSYFLNSK